MKRIIEKNFIYLAISVVGLLLLVSTALTYYNREVMQQALAIKYQIAEIKRETENSYTGVRQMDVSLRGFAIITEDEFFFYKTDKVKKENERMFERMDELLASIGYSDPENYNDLKKGMDQYIERYAQMEQVLKEGRRDEFLAFMRKDYGRYFWEVYAKFSTKLYTHLDNLNLEADTKYRDASSRNLFVQFLMIILGLPTLLLLTMKLIRQNAAQKSLLNNLDTTNRKFLFNPGTETSENEREILENSMINLQKASNFVNKISEGNYEVKWDNLTQENSSLNKENLVGRLILMREEMKKVKIEEQTRLWVTEGLSQFSDIIRNNQDDFKELTEKCLVFIVKYLKSQQGSLFVIKEKEGEQSILELITCYAFDRKKYLNKEIGIGEGLVGQVYLEKATTVLTEIPQGYTRITSGLGDNTPSCLLIVPMTYNEEVKAVVELASFYKYLPHEISFVEKAGEFLASAIASAKNSEKTQKLLDEFKTQTEQMRAQEEELRQNMEELETTQEEMRRKERELENRLVEAKLSKV